MPTKIHLNLEKTLRMRVILIFFQKILAKTFVKSKKRLTFADANQGSDLQNIYWDMV